MKNSKQWWDETKNNPAKLNNWLQRQCYGEYQAYKRIKELSKRFDNVLLEKIANQEYKHYKWIRNYLETRGINPITEHDERYWKEVNLDFQNIEQASAVGHHAEVMRLERIKVIAQDNLHSELATIFKKIQKDEEFHFKAFKSLTTEEDIEIAKIDHEIGMLQLGLTI
jgi:hypothetical protein